MAVQPQGARRIATGAVVAAVVATVLVGVGVGVGTADERPAAAPASAVPALPALPSRAAVRAPAAAPPAPTTRAAAAPTARAEPPEQAEEESEPEPTRERAAVPSVAVPVQAPVAPSLVPGTPCTTAARACVDLESRTAWLFEQGRIRRGPVSVQIGDEIDPTPHGTFTVEWKAEQWTSREFLTQMPYSVFFAEGGIAFHEGAQDTNSAGCVKLVHADAVAFFEYLQVGDQVQIR